MPHVFCYFQVVNIQEEVKFYVTFQLTWQWIEYWWNYKNLCSVMDQL